MLDSLYLARLDCVKVGNGDIGHVEPVSLTELNTHNQNPFRPRHYRRGNNGAQPDHGFGFAFWPYTTVGLHRARVMCLDFSRWQLRHLVHFMCKFSILNALNSFVGQHKLQKS